jgi:hypothetical protein
LRGGTLKMGLIAKPAQSFNGVCLCECWKLQENVVHHTDAQRGVGMMLLRKMSDFEYLNYHHNNNQYFNLPN